MIANYAPIPFHPSPPSENGTIRSKSAAAINLIPRQQGIENMTSLSDAHVIKFYSDKKVFGSKFTNRNKSTLAVAGKIPVSSGSTCNCSLIKRYLTLPYLTKVRYLALSLPGLPWTSLAGGHLTQAQPKRFLLYY
jgi:hypothetical protein